MPLPQQRVRRGVAGYKDMSLMDDKAVEEAPEKKVIQKPPETKVIKSKKAAKK